jgi:hypothetical protein
VVAKFRERLSARKQETKNDVERYNMKKLNKMKIRKQFQIELSNWFAALEN